MGLFDIGSSDRNWGANVDENKRLAAATGYNGDFGGGKYQAWAAANPGQAAMANQPATGGQEPNPFQPPTFNPQPQVQSQQAPNPQLAYTPPPAPAPAPANPYMPTGNSIGQQAPQQKMAGDQAMPNGAGPGPGMTGNNIGPQTPNQTTIPLHSNVRNGPSLASVIGSSTAQQAPKQYFSGGQYHDASQPPPANATQQQKIDYANAVIGIGATDEQKRKAGLGVTDTYNTNAEPIWDPRTAYMGNNQARLNNGYDAIINPAYKGLDTLDARTTTLGPKDGGFDPNQGRHDYVNYDGSQYFGNEPEQIARNKALAQETGYTGNFGGGQFQAWMGRNKGPAGQSPQTGGVEQNPEFGGGFKQGELSQESYNPRMNPMQNGGAPTAQRDAMPGAMPTAAGDTNSAIPADMAAQFKQHMSRSGMNEGQLARFMANSTPADIQAVLGGDGSKLQSWKFDHENLAAAQESNRKQAEPYTSANVWGQKTPEQQRTEWFAANPWANKKANEGGPMGAPTSTAYQPTASQTPASNTGPRDFGKNPALNQRLASELGYQGGFGTGQFNTWLGSQSAATKAKYSQIIGSQQTQPNPSQTQNPANNKVPPTTNPATTGRPPSPGPGYTWSGIGWLPPSNQSSQPNSNIRDNRTGSVNPVGQQYFNPKLLEGSTTSTTGGNFNGQNLFGMGISKINPLENGAPDFMTTANAQSQANIGQQLGTSNINNPNQYGPNGSRVRTLNADGSYSLVDTLSPDLQRNNDAANALKYQMLNNAQDAAGNQLSYEGLSPSAQFDASGVKGLQDLDMSGVSGIPNADQNTLQAARDSVYNQQTQYLDPQFNRAQADLENKLANQGIPRGSEAFTRAMSEFGDTKQRAYNDARMSAVQAGGAEQSRLFGLGAEQHKIGATDALAKFGAGLQGHQTGMQDATTMFNAAMQGRQQGVSEANQLHNSPINDLSALNAQTQIQMPQYQGFSATGGANVDYLGAANMQNNANTGLRLESLAKENAGNASSTQNRNAVLSLLSAGLSMPQIQQMLGSGMSSLFNLNSGGGGSGGIVDEEYWLNNPFFGSAP